MSAARRWEKAHGAYAQFAVCTPEQVHHLPERISFTQGAGLFVPYVTAWRALFGRANTRADDTVLIHGASGGVGVAATQFALAAGAIVIGTAGSEEGVAVVKAQGAQHAVNHKAAGYLDQITTLSGGRGPDVILEMLANVNLDHDLTVVAPGASRRGDRQSRPRRDRCAQDHDEGCVRVRTPIVGNPASHEIRRAARRDHRGTW